MPELSLYSDLNFDGLFTKALPCLMSDGVLGMPPRYFNHSIPFSEPSCFTESKNELSDYTY